MSVGQHCRVEKVKHVEVPGGIERHVAAGTLFRRWERCKEWWAKPPGRSPPAGPGFVTRTGGEKRQDIDVARRIQPDTRGG